MEKNRIKTALSELEQVFRDDATLQEVYEGLIKVGIEGLKRDKDLAPMVFIVLRDTIDNKYRVMLYPLFVNENLTKDKHAETIKKLVKDFKDGNDPHFQIVAVLRGANATMSKYDTKDVLKADGSVDQDKLNKLRAENTNLKNVLLFEMEEAFIKHTRSYEYVEFGDGEIVVNPVPLVDRKTTYDIRMAKNDKLAFLFTEGQSLN